MFTRFLCGVAFAALSVSAASADDLPTVLITTDKSKVTLVFDRAHDEMQNFLRVYPRPTPGTLTLATPVASPPILPA
jgi:hypothetical protein